MSERFLQLFSDPAPALRVKFRETDLEAKTIQVEHRLGSIADVESRHYLESLGENSAIAKFCEFYQKHDGLELCRTYDARHGRDRPLIEFKPAKGITKFTSRYLDKGGRAWTIDLNKSKRLYRGPADWIVFAEIDSGPACLTIFLDGENAGCVYYVTPQPEFNILRPIARGFQPLLDRMAKDLPAFLRLVRAYVSLRGADGHNYGFMPFEYLARGNDGLRFYEN